MIDPDMHSHFRPWPHRSSGPHAAQLIGRYTTGPASLSRTHSSMSLDVNRTHWPPELESIATSLRGAASESLDRAEVLASLLLHVESAVDELAQNGAAATIGALREHLAMVGDEIEIDGRAGVLAGIDDDGLLLVREGAQLRRVASGTLRRRG